MNIKIVGFYHRKTPPYNVAVGGTKGRFFWILFTYKIKKNISIARIGVSSRLERNLTKVKCSCLPFHILLHINFGTQTYQYFLNKSIQGS